MGMQQYPPDPRIQEGYQQAPNEGYGVANDTVRSSNINGAQMQSQHESYIDPAGNRVESQAEIFEDKNIERANRRYWVTTITYFILGVLEVLLGLRLLFRLFGAHQDNGFITFLYSLTHVFVGAFNGIFNDQTLGSSNVFEVSTIIAMLVYALIAWGIVSLGRVIFATTLTGRQRQTTTRRSRAS